MFRFSERERKQFVECLGKGPHSTKNGSRWLVVGFHRYVQIEDGTVRCERCAGKREIPKAPDYDKPIITFKLSEADRTLSRKILRNIRKAFETMEEGVPTKVTVDDEPTERQQVL